MDDKMNRAIDPQDADAQEKVRELRRIAFDGNDGGAVDVAKDVTTRQHHNKISPRDFRKLGFKNDTTPLNDFGNMIFFSIYSEENNNNKTNCSSSSTRCSGVGCYALFCSISPGEIYSGCPGELWTG